jgi:hypothetical protein
MVRILMTIGILSISLIGRSQVNDSLFAVFNYLTPDGYGWIRIELMVNKTFVYTRGACMDHFFSNGHWKIKKDTLILNSDMQKNNIPVMIRESKAETRDSLYIGLATDLSGYLVKDAGFFYNDSIKSCMPAFDECRFYKGTVKRIKATFSNGLSSDWYTIKDPSTTYIEPVLNLNFALDRYFFLTNNKYLVQGKGLYPLYETIKKIRGKDKAVLVKDTALYFKQDREEDR